MAFADPPDASARSADRTVFADCPNEVLTTAGMKAARRAEQRADETLVQTHTADQQQRGQLPERASGHASPLFLWRR